MNLLHKVNPTLTSFSEDSYNQAKSQILKIPFGHHTVAGQCAPCAYNITKVSCLLTPVNTEMASRENCVVIP